MSTQSDAVKKWLSANNIKQVAVAEATGIDKATVSNFLAGRRPLSNDNSKRLADAFGFSLLFLLTGEGSLFPDAATRRAENISHSTITQGDNSPINIVADNAALEAENQRLRAEVEWLRGMLESATRVQPSKD